jgi:hypothetical protein
LRARPICVFASFADANIEGWQLIVDSTRVWQFWMELRIEDHAQAEVIRGKQAG